MNAPANLLAIMPALRAKRIDWKIVQQKRIEAGYAWPAKPPRVEISKDISK